MKFMITSGGSGQVVARCQKNARMVEVWWVKL
jgi:hypothetical protein